MRKIIAAAFVSLDGVMQGPGGPTEDPTGGFTQGGWTVTFWDETMEQFMGGMFGDAFDLLLGRKTYEIFAAHWPYLEDDPISVLFNGVTKYVVTSSASEPLNWVNSVRVTGDVPGEIAKLKQGDGPNLLIQGSSVLLQTLLEHNLIDEFRLLTLPVVLGSGKRLFGTGTRPGALKLVESGVSKTGVIVSVYHPAGAIPIGSFQSAQPSEAEGARQDRMKHEG
ncbi:MAG: bifunctional deaminase-reductase domain protein [Devosia sp.]|uniref:dihydrofolate reductase family protein n=1 Tax=Devosia sp. TaxID=1871048 RepID=UPI0026351063|nr:dihydrofolate reductase family protein [Devosia sp.]MDB5585189.1 bifunctional deaminase-reductase domain protein [Devosia sp.]